LDKDGKINIKLSVINFEKMAIIFMTFSMLFDIQSISGDTSILLDQDTSTIPTSDVSISDSLAQDIISFQTGTFLDNTEVRAILGGVIGFWGGVFGMGSIFLTMVMLKRCIHNKTQDDGD